MLQLIDKLAGWWLDWRTEQAIASRPELQEFGLKKVEFDENGFHVIASFPGVYLLADEAAQMLEACNAKNYVEFDMMPRLDRQLSPIRVTVRWANGLAPSQKAARLTDLAWIAYGVLREWPLDHPRREQAMNVCRQVVDFCEATPWAGGQAAGGQETGVGDTRWKGGE